MTILIAHVLVADTWGTCIIKSETEPNMSGLPISTETKAF